MRFQLTLRCDNAAFKSESRPELDSEATKLETARILRLVAEAVESGTHAAPLHDSNGNQIGSFAFVNVS